MYQIISNSFKLLGKITCKLYSLPYICVFGLALKLIICRTWMYSSVADDQISRNGLETHRRRLFVKITNRFVCCLWVKTEDELKNYVVRIINQKYMFGTNLIKIGSLF